MGYYYVLSDIHGFYRQLYARFDQLGNLHTVIDNGGEDKLILLGDYIDGGPNSFKTIDMIFCFQEGCPENVIVLRGNHEDMFLDYLDGKDDAWLGADVNLNTSKTFLLEDQLKKVEELSKLSNVNEANSYIRTCIKENHKDLISWMRKLPYYYETEEQIFVHAGIDEEAGEYWKVGTPDYYFVSKYPATTGKFHKDIIAGHIGTSTISGNPNFNDIYYDGKSHYYIDGTVALSGYIPILVYDEIKKKYYSLENEEHPIYHTREDRYRVRGELRLL